MSERIESREFDSLRIFSESELDSNGRQFSKCVFDNCRLFSGFSYVENERPTLSNFEFLSCSAGNCVVGPVHLENVLVKGLKTKRNGVSFYGTTFSRLSVEGVCGKVWISDITVLAGVKSRFVAVVRQQNKEYYDTVDWAIDISKAEFKDLTIRGVPGELIRINPEIQAIVSFDRFEKFLTRYEGPNSQYFKALSEVHGPFQMNFPIVASKGEERRFQSLVSEFRRENLLLDPFTEPGQVLET